MAVSGVSLTVTLFVTFLVILNICYSKAQRDLRPPYFNLAEGRKITASATCGVPETELYCKLVGANVDKTDNPKVSLIQGQFCDYCQDDDPNRDHRPEYAIDGSERWWQSPPLSRGLQYNEVNLTIDLGQEFHVAYVFIKMANSPRPSVWALERSTDFGSTFSAWQYFADSPSECWEFFRLPANQRRDRDDSVICSTDYKGVIPLENGEIVVSLVNERPNALNFSYAEDLQRFTRATTVRLRLLRPKTLFAHLMALARQDSTVTRRYFYSIKDISIGGRCMCFGHAETCDIKDPNNDVKLLCRCQHYTCGPQCEKCCPGFVQKRWKPSTFDNINACEACNCFGHSDECDYDEEVDYRRLSIDIHGNYEGGGVCKNCQHNTEGINCNQCKAGFYRPRGVFLNSTYVCVPCNCDLSFSTGSCAEETGQCECRPEFASPNCDRCSIGHFGYPYCTACQCNVNGTENQVCEVGGGQCPCRYNFVGRNCDQCAATFYGFPSCLPCECNSIGALDTVCEPSSGQCRCKNNFAGRRCDECADGFYSYPICQYCSCDSTGCVEEICKKETGQCLCKKGFTGSRCDQCLPGYYGYPHCRECECEEVGSVNEICDSQGRCSCKSNFAGRNCERCSPGYYKYPECRPCSCNQYGALGISCDDNGHCSCRQNFDGQTCNQCKDGFYNFPTCEECNCDPAGVVTAFGGCGSVTGGDLCQCKERVTGRICNQCKPLYWNLQTINPRGCEECHCYTPGTLGGIGICDGVTGQCICKPNVGSRQCRECKDGSYNLQDSSLFGCQDCGCDIGGAADNGCDKHSGQCTCRPRINGRRCNEPLQTHYFPTLHHLKYELEDGRTPSNTAVRFGYDDSVFPEFSWRGYATFSQIQPEVIVDVTVRKPLLYLLVVRYLNRGHKEILGKVTANPEQYGLSEQSGTVKFQPTSYPSYVTVGGDVAITPFDLSPGRWSISVKTEEPVLVDYIVFLPPDYYEAGLLHQKVHLPCEIGQHSQVCRHFSYPTANGHPQARGDSGFIARGDDRERTQLFQDQPILHELGVSNMALLNKDQNYIHLDVIVNKIGKYVLVISYYTPENGATQDLMVDVATPKGRDKGRAIIYNCQYSSVCRQVITDENAKVLVFDVQSKFISLTLSGLQDVNVALDSVIAIPVEDWDIDFVQPGSQCIKVDGQCIQSKFGQPSGSIKLEMESGYNADRLSESNPPGVSEDVGLVELNSETAPLDLSGQVATSGKYIFAVHYYQPNHAKFSIPVVLQTDHIYESLLTIPHCPSYSGCRAVITAQDGRTAFDVMSNFMITINIPEHKDIWLDYILAIPRDVYTDEVLIELPRDVAGDFITMCGKNHFDINSGSSQFCKESVFSLTSEYNDGALPCECNSDGSRSFQCEQFGGQCNCKPNVIGRTCSACKTGYYGFPNCRPCNCPHSNLCDPISGHCICPPKVTGERCNVCESHTFGYDPLIGCEDCDCNVYGVLQTLDCDQQSGQCSCKPNVIGRQCNRCVRGHYAFPSCYKCEYCVESGTQHDICNQESGDCLCKENVGGAACDVCKPSTFYLDERNPKGCTKCFCFGTTNRCASSELAWGSVIDMSNWRVSNIPGVHSDSSRDTVRVFENRHPSDSNEPIYWVAPTAYLGNKVTSYGGRLTYTIMVSPGSDSQELNKADIILFGNNFTLIHVEDDTPRPDTSTTITVDILEHNFRHQVGGAVSREQLMMVLADVQALHIRASYYSTIREARLSNVVLDVGVEDEQHSRNMALSVEQCHCPPNYRGTSCEECAEGYYRSMAGPYLGVCRPCQCHGHADSCEPHTGRCINCKHNTTGDQCEKCAPGYHGYPIHGTSYDCSICACPLPLPSNNFAISCEVTDANLEILCECQRGYTGTRCERCAPGYYGQPEVVGGRCEPCQCSGNIDTNNPSSCDPITGQCLLCENNSGGPACSTCAVGFYGDAVLYKNCQQCSCNSCGTSECNHFTGECVCHPNVVGEGCRECTYGYWNFDSCRGCSNCDCGAGSESNQCDVRTGQCPCRPGVAGRSCDHCDIGYWNFSPHGCIRCDCDSTYSVGSVCNPFTGSCECLPGVTGDNCDTCLYRWVLIENVGCAECDICVHMLLDEIEPLTEDLVSAIRDLNKTVPAYFINLRLDQVNRTANQLRPKVDLLIQDPNKVNLGPVSVDVAYIETYAGEIYFTANATMAESIKIAADSKNASDEAKNILNLLKGVTLAVRVIVDQIKGLEKGITDGAVVSQEQYIATAERLLDLIRSRDFDPKEGIANDELDQARNLLDRAKDLLNDVKNVLDDGGIKESEFDNLEDRLRDLINNSQQSIKDAREALDLLEKFKLTGISTLSDIIKAAAKRADEDIDNGDELLDKARKYLDDAEKSYNKLIELPPKMNDATERLRNFIETVKDGIDDVSPIVDDAHAHAENLDNQAEELDKLLADTRHLTGNAIKAANAYQDIVAAIEQARVAANEAVDSVDNATSLSDGLIDVARSARNISLEFMGNAKEAEAKVSGVLKPQLAAAKKEVEEVGQMNQETDDGVKELNRAMDALPTSGVQSVAIKAADQAAAAEEKSKENMAKVQTIVENLPEDKKRVDEIPANIKAANEAIIKSQVQVARVKNHLPSVLRLLGVLESNWTVIKRTGEDLGEKIRALKVKVALARDEANRIKTGMTFNQTTALQVRNPDNLHQAATYTHLSLFFNTNEKNALLLYLGNVVGTSVKGKGEQTDDYMAIEIQNGYIVVVYDLGSGPAQIIVSQKYVSDGNWHQVIVERIGQIATVTVRTEDEADAVATGYAQGSRSVLNLDNRISKFFIGGVPETVELQPEIRSRNYAGELGEVEFEKNPIGLWNFVEGQNNNEGCLDRYQLDDPTAETGLKFDGKGFAIYNHNHKRNMITSTSVLFKFKTYAANGVLFFVGEGKTYLFLELRDGRVVFQFEFGSGPAVLISNKTYSDGEWHSVEANRENSQGILKIDNEKVASGSTPGSEMSLMVTEEMFLGGLPSSVPVAGIGITSQSFEGCIEDFQLGTRNFDLSSSKQAFGVVSGCPATIARSVSFTGQGGYVAMTSVNVNRDLQITFKFKTSHPNGLIIFSSSEDQKETLSVSLINGSLSLRVTTELQDAGLATLSAAYNDNKWHYVTVTKSGVNLNMDIDDVEALSGDGPTASESIETKSPLYFGGVPERYSISLAINNFTGCLGDATVNKKFQNFADALDRPGASLISCPLEDPVITVSGVEKIHITVEEETTYKSSVDIIPPDSIRPLTTQETLLFADNCALPLRPRGDPELIEANGKHFGLTIDSHIEYHIDPKDVRLQTEFSLEFRTSSKSGILIYVDDKKQVDFIAIYLTEGKIRTAFNFGSGASRITSPDTYNDGRWHELKFLRNEVAATLVIDGQPVAEGKAEGTTRSLNISPPLYLGGIGTSEAIIKSSSKNLEGNLRGFTGCIRNFQVLNSPKVTITKEVNSPPCSEKFENGTFFSKDGGYISLYDKFRVGISIIISMDIKPRTSSGILFAVHSNTTDYLILQMVDGNISLTVDNGKGAFTTSILVPSICNGEWHRIQAIKDKNFATVTVDENSSVPGFGTAGVSATDTNNPLYLGGVPDLNQKGILTTKHYVGCIKEVTVNKKKVTFPESAVHGHVLMELCPTI